MERACNHSPPPSVGPGVTGGDRPVRPPERPDSTLDLRNGPFDARPPERPDSMAHTRRTFRVEFVGPTCIRGSLPKNFVNDDHTGFGIPRRSPTRSRRRRTSSFATPFGNGVHRTVEIRFQAVAVRHHRWQGDRDPRGEAMIGAELSDHGTPATTAPTLRRRERRPRSRSPNWSLRETRRRPHSPSGHRVVRARLPVPLRRCRSARRTPSAVPS